MFAVLIFRIAEIAGRVVVCPCPFVRIRMLSCRCCVVISTSPWQKHCPRYPRLRPKIAEELPSRYSKTLRSFCRIADACRRLRLVTVRHATIGLSSAVVARVVRRRQEDIRTAVARNSLYRNSYIIQDPCPPLFFAQHWQWDALWVNLIWNPKQILGSPFGLSGTLFWQLFKSWSNWRKQRIQRIPLNCSFARSLLY